QPPATFAEFEKAAHTVNTPPDRYAFGLMGRQGPGSYSSFASWLFSAGGKLVDFKTGEVFINDAQAVTALQFYVDLVLKHKVVPPARGGWRSGARESAAAAPSAAVPRHVRKTLLAPGGGRGD